MKRILKFIYLWLGVEYWYLTENEKICHYCASSPIFSPDGLGPYRYSYTIACGGSIKGFMVCQKSTWYISIGDNLLAGKLKTVKALSDLRKSVKS